MSFGITGAQDSYTAAVQSRTDLYDFTNHGSGRVAGDVWTLSVGDQSAVYTVATTDEEISVVVQDWYQTGVMQE